MTAVWDNFIGPLQMSNRYQLQHPGSIQLQFIPI